MPNDQMQYYLLTHDEAELVACYRLMSENAQETVALIVSSQAGKGCHNYIKPVKLSVVKKS